MTPDNLLNSLTSLVRPAEAHNYLANALSEKHLIAEAVTAFQQALDHKPDIAGARNNIGTAHHIIVSCPNNFCKINEPLLKAWAQVLGKVKNSRLVLSREGSHPQRTLDVLLRGAIGRRRVNGCACGQPLWHTGRRPVGFEPACTNRAAESRGAFRQRLHRNPRASGDHLRLAVLRRSQQPRMETSPLMNASQFARNFESGYRAIWRHWCARS